MMLAVLFQRCTKLLNLLENVNTEHASSGGHIHVQPLCPTRVLCKGEGIKALLKNLETVLSALLCCPYEGARWSSGINAVNGARRPRFASRILPTVRATLDKSLTSHCL